jgi:hypothetical protein
MKSLLALPAAFLLAGIASSPPAAAATPQDVLPSIDPPATLHTAQLRDTNPLGNSTGLPAVYTIKVGYPPSYRLFRRGN